MAQLDRSVLKHVDELMQASRRTLGLWISYKHLRGGFRGGGAWRGHMTPCCRAAKRQQEGQGRDICTRFDVGEVPRALARKPEGRIHVCPFGFTELAVPVPGDGAMAGVLFAGQCWLGKGPPPYPGLVVPPDRQWLDDRLVILRGIADQLGRLLRKDDGAAPVPRRERILAFLEASLRRPVRLPDLARRLDLSPPHAGREVKRLFGKSFPRLCHETKMREAARLLAATDAPIREIAVRVGYADANHLSRLFRQEFKMPPRAYRRAHRADA